MYIAKALSSISFLIFAATLSTSNNAPHHIVSLPKFLSPAALARICHINSGSSLIIEDDSEKPADGIEWERRAHSFGDMKHLMNSPECIEANNKDSMAVSKMPLDRSKLSTFKVILAGAPASGKGTQCEMIQNNFGLVHLSTGDILRDAVKKGTALGLIVKPYMDEGHLVPDELVIELILNRLKDHDCETRGWLLDGFPRTKSQANALQMSGILPDVFLLLDVPKDILVERVTGRRTDPLTGKIYHLKFNPPENDEIASRLVQRSDDTAEKVIIRFEEYQDHIDEIKSSYEDKMVLIDGSMKPSEVTCSVVTELDKAIFKKRESFADRIVESELRAETMLLHNILSFPESVKVEASVF